MSGRSRAMRDSAARLIRGSGKLVSYVLVTPGEYSTATGKATVTKTATDIRAVLSAVTKVYDKQDGSQIGDMKATVSALDVTNPTPGDRMLIDGNEWAVVGVSPVYFEDDPVTYKLHVRRT